MERLRQPEQEIPRIGIYEHFKSSPEDRRYYQVLGIARHTETEEALVIYLPLYEDETEHRNLGTQARPVEMFIETVEHEGQIVPRFRYIGQQL